MKTIATFLVAVLVSATTFFSITVKAQPAAKQGLEQWANNHKKASDALAAWVKAHPAGAHYIFEWDGTHPDRSQALVTWALNHPKENLNVFHAEHRDWPELDDIERTYMDAMQSFLVWVRNHGPAARALMAHSRALRWAGDHLYKSSLTMEH